MQVTSNHTLQLGSRRCLSRDSSAPGEGSMPYNILDLGALNKNLSVAFAITNCGQVAGWIGSPVPPATLGTPLPFIWTQGIMQLLPLAAPAASGQAFDLNGQGQVVGNTYNTI